MVEDYENDEINQKGLYIFRLFSIFRMFRHSHFQPGAQNEEEDSGDDSLDILHRVCSNALFPARDIDYFG